MELVCCVGLTIEHIASDEQSYVSLSFIYISCGVNIAANNNVRLRFKLSTVMFTYVNTVWWWWWRSYNIGSQLMFSLSLVFKFTLHNRAYTRDVFREKSAILYAMLEKIYLHTYIDFRCAYLTKVGKQTKKFTSGNRYFMKWK